MISTSSSQYASGTHPLKNLRAESDLMQKQTSEKAKVNSLGQKIVNDHNREKTMLDKIKSFRTNVDGEVSFVLEVDKAAQVAQNVTQRTEINALEQWELEDFINVEGKLFSFFELCQLMQSSSHHHAAYALRIIDNLI